MFKTKAKYLTTCDSCINEKLLHEHKKNEPILSLFDYYNRIFQLLTDRTIKGHLKQCLHCDKDFVSKRSDTKYCSGYCRSIFHHKKKLYKAKNLLEKIKDLKVNYVRLTFVLSIIGFLGSIGFYIVVLRKIYADAAPNQVQVELVKTKKENEQLRSQVVVLTDMIRECKEHE